MKKIIYSAFVVVLMITAIACRETTEEKTEATTEDTTMSADQTMTTEETAAPAEVEVVADSIPPTTEGEQ